MTCTNALPMSRNSGSRGSRSDTQQNSCGKPPQLGRRLMRACGKTLVSASGTKPANAGNTGAMSRLRMRARILRWSSASILAGFSQGCSGCCAQVRLTKHSVLPHIS